MYPVQIKGVTVMCTVMCCDITGNSYCKEIAGLNPNDATTFNSQEPRDKNSTIANCWSVGAHVCGRRQKTLSSKYAL